MVEYTPTPDFYNDYIAHYGVKGMKWRRRKATKRNPGINTQKDPRFQRQSSGMTNDPRYDNLYGENNNRYSRIKSKKSRPTRKSVSSSAGANSIAGRRGPWGKKKS